MVTLLTIGTISNNLVFGQGNIGAHGSGGGCGTAHCSHDPFGVGGNSGYTGGYGSGGTIITDESSSIDADGGGAGYGQYDKEGAINHCGGGGGGAYRIVNGEGERIGGGTGGGGSC